MKRLKSAVFWLLTLAIISLALDYYLVNAKDTRVASAVKQLGGRFGSLPAWPLGTEYDISFDHPLTELQLDQLAELNELRGSVGVRFINCELSTTEQANAARLLESCHVTWIPGREDDAALLVTPN